MRNVNLGKSFVFVNTNKDCCWRVSVKSLLINLTDNKKYYLTKECRAEIVGQYPFTHPNKSEICIIFEDKKIKYLIRDNPVLKKNDFVIFKYKVFLSLCRRS